MSDLSVLIHKAENFFEGLVAAHPAPTITNAKLSLTQAATAVEASIPDLIKAGVDGALAAVPGGLGVEFTPLANTVIDGIIAVLTQHKATLAAAPAHPAPVASGVAA
jgi:hypothetical protein